MPVLDDVDHVLRQDLEAEKMRYKGQLAELKELKREIEHLQHLLEKGKVQNECHLFFHACAFSWVLITGVLGVALVMVQMVVLCVVVCSYQSC